MDWGVRESLPGIEETSGAPSFVNVCPGRAAAAIFIDGSSNEKGAGARVFARKSQRKPKAAVKFRFAASNNKAEYKALLIWIHLVKKTGAESIKIYSNSQLIVHQITEEYQAKKDKMASYLRQVKSELEQLKSFIILQIPKEKNSVANALAHLASAMSQEKIDLILIKFLPSPNILAPQELVLVTG
ncbi:uncharacterized protein LOC116114054 [Pistacia vera]|uniref:uncharacterized protein LOC116114054 n=1 Tax=Pistacia vera TaxID=55513 RepID=UPI001263A865|nr:uncharacterized protein LOC116114054 [Pistacia vera]